MSYIDDEELKLGDTVEEEELEEDLDLEDGLGDLVDDDLEEDDLADDLFADEVKGLEDTE